MNQEKHEEKIPAIAEQLNQKMPIIIVGIAIIICIMGGLYWHQKKKPEQAKPVQEVYAVTANEIPIEPKELKEPVNSPEVKIEKKENDTPQINPEILQQQIALIREKQKLLQQRLSAPLMVVTQNASSAVTRSAEEKVAVAKPVGSLDGIIAQGSFILANLESASNSDLPGSLRASVSEEVYSEDGTRVLIPKGSRLIGQYKNGILQGQSRFFVVWTRLLTPDGISIQLNSPGIDPLGVVGLNADEINRHFWERFGMASLLSLIGAGASTVGVANDDQNNSLANYREAVASSFSQSANQSLQRDNFTAPTLKTYQGKQIIVFVARDLHFEAVLKKNTQKFNIL